MDSAIFIFLLFISSIYDIYDVVSLTTVYMYGKIQYLTLKSWGNDVIIKKQAAFEAVA